MKMQRKMSAKTIKCFKTMKSITITTAAKYQKEGGSSKEVLKNQSPNVEGFVFGMFILY